MISTIAVLGAGKVGGCIAETLSEKYSVIVADRADEVLQRFKNNKKIRTIECDLSGDISGIKILSEADLFVGAVPGWMGFSLMQKLALFGKPVVDISFFPEDARLLDVLYKEHHALLIPDAGVAPGLSNFILGYYNSLLPLHSFMCYVGGLPKERIYPHEYTAPFSPIDVIEEYTRPARYITDGIIVTDEALSAPEMISFDGVGELEAFNTDGLRSLLHTIKLDNMKEMTLRYPKHAEYMRFLKAAGFFDSSQIQINGAFFTPRDFTAKILTDGWKGKPGYDEFTVLRIDMSFKVGERDKTLRCDLYDERDYKTNFTSMERTTGFTCCSFVELIHEGLTGGEGVLFPEYLPNDKNIYERVIGYLRSLGIKISFTESFVS
ncbi:MAG: hypothetical protein AMXMBFR48_03220 [Ignavibacteriales bacterium]